MSFRVSFLMPNVFTGYDIGCKLWVCTLKISLKCQFDKWFAWTIAKERMPAVGLVRLASRALITLRWRYKWRHRRLKWRANVRAVISDTHQLLLANWNGIKRDQWYFIGDKTNSQTVQNRKSYHHCLKQWNFETVK